MVLFILFIDSYKIKMARPVTELEIIEPMLFTCMTSFLQKVGSGWRRGDQQGSEVSFEQLAALEEMFQ